MRSTRGRTILGGALAFGLGLGLTLRIGLPVSDRGSGCSERVPAGPSERAAGQVLELFARTTIVGGEPRCRAELVTSTAGTVPLFRTRHPDRADGWFQLAPLVRNARGLPEYAAFLYLHAAGARPAAFELLLELHGSRWLVSHVAVARGSTEVDVSRLPT